MLSPRCLPLLFLACTFAAAQTHETAPATVIAGVSVTPAAHPEDGDAAQTYILGPEDKLTVKVLDLEEISDKDVYRVDMRGNLNLPVAGRVHVSGLTVEQAETEIESRLMAILQNPRVTLSLSEFRPEPVSVLGAVRNPGVVQITGAKTLYEVLSLAGGLNPDAGNTIKVTRAKKSGPLPLPNAADDPTGQYRVAELNVRAVMEAQNPEENIPVLPHDVISVPKADLVYVVGCVKKSGGFVLSEREKISVLQALSMAEGLDHGASPAGAKILRAVGASDNRVEIPVDLRKLLEGKGDDVPLLANDILFVPTSMAKNAALRTIEAAIQIGTGVAIYRP
ncbi:MAG: polysaccharide biosynthesis/export family protein [Bryobacteraceae bacterium]|jgi:polysaccharide export outer membrane protein